MRLAALPAGALELRDEMLLTRKADTEIGDEGPGARNVERLGDRARIEDRHPADAEAAGFAPFFFGFVVCARARGAMARATSTSVAPRE